jgi:hypothetical protein
MCQESQFELTRVNIRIKVIIIIVLKLDSASQPGQDPGYGSVGSARVDSSQCKDKKYYYYSFKTRFDDQTRQGLGHGSRGSTWVDPSQFMDKSGYYYYGFKT